MKAKSLLRSAATSHPIERLAPHTPPWSGLFVPDGGHFGSRGFQVVGILAQTS